MRAEEMNECVMNGNGTSVCRSREEERLKMKKGRRIREDVRRGGGGGGVEGDARYSASEGVLACLCFTVSHIISHRHTHA